MTAAPRIERVRHELKRRTLTVKRVERSAQQMVRIVFEGDALGDFISLGFDDHVKLFFPSTEAGAPPEMRDFTPRHFNREGRELTIDFFLHAAGPAAAWAAQAKAGQTLDIAGPRGSAVISMDGIDTHVLVGDETAIPAIARRLSELPSGARAIVVIEHDAGARWPAFDTAAEVVMHWVQRSEHAVPYGHELIDALRGVALPPGTAFFWVAVESRAARAIRRYLTDERGIDKQWIKAAGYWQRGATGAHDPLADEQ